MDLFASAGMDVPSSGRGRASRRATSPRTLHVPLFNHRVLEDARRRLAFAPSAAEVEAARDYARRARGAGFARQKETSVRPLFFSRVLSLLLGYREYDPEAAYSLSHEHPIRSGSADAALGRFSGEKQGEIVAPCEVKGPGTLDLDAIASGRLRSPVQQAWDYAIDAPGSRWVIVTNCVELRLYAFGRGRDAYHLFDLRRLDDPDEHARLWLLLSADRLLGDATDALLRETDSAYKEVSAKLYEDYRTLRDKLIAFLTGSADGPKLAAIAAIEPAQKILDRVLFIAFAQRTGLISQPVLERAAKAHNEFAPVPKWTNFQGLFRWCNVGNFDSDIEAFNGGLFAPDPILDAIVVPDWLVAELASLAQWDYRSDVPVTILGHLFEQSVTDLEKLRAASEGKPEPDESKGARKRHGIVYTPETVTRFLVDRTIGLTLRDREAALLAEHAALPSPPLGEGTARDAIAWRDGEASERAFWRGYLETLRNLAILDPACGSGAFLVAAFDTLAAEYRRVIERLVVLGEPLDFDPLDWIVTKNLYGVDINAESVEITRLSLWLKTARRKHRLQNLEGTIKHGDSLIDSAEFTRAPFDWEARFPQVFAKGGFDVVIGNPPYVRSERIASIKTYLQSNYKVFRSGADLYCYFLEKGIQLIKEGGRLGFITSNSYHKASFWSNMREYLNIHTKIETSVDFGDSTVFSDITTYPSTLTLKKMHDDIPYVISCANLSNNQLHNDIDKSFLHIAFDYPSNRLSRSRWHFEPEPLYRLRNQMEKRAESYLGDLSVPVNGIKTGLTKAFNVSSFVREKLSSQDSNSASLIRPFLSGADLGKWNIKPANSHIIFIPRGWTNSTFGKSNEQEQWKRIGRKYPAISVWLKQFETEALKRSDKGDFWWELRPCDYYSIFDDEVVVYPEMSQGPKFAWKSSGSVTNNKSFLIPNSNLALLAFLNSRASWFLLRGICSALRGGKWRLELRTDFLRDLPIPSLDIERVALTQLGRGNATRSHDRLQVQSDVRSRTAELSPGRKLSGKLERWWELDFAGFLAEVKHTLKAEIPLRRRSEWESYFVENREAVRRLTSEIEAAEHEIDAIVYRLFELTPDEILLLEASLAGQY